MANSILKLGCFITGYNYNLVKQSSETCTKTVKKNFSAMMLVIMIWGFIGFSFTQRYLHGNLLTALFGAAIAIFAIILVERQVLLSPDKNKWTARFRVLIGIVMAIIGSLILDQIVFADDIEKKKIENVQNETSRLLPIRTKELRDQVAQITSSILAKENERSLIIDEITRKPMIIASSTTRQSQRDSQGRVTGTNVTVSAQAVQNPKIALIEKVDEQLKVLQAQKATKEDDIINAQELLRASLESKFGFLDELKVLFSILFSSWIACFVWALLFAFFAAIELFVLVNKMYDRENDYDKLVLHQRDVRIKMIEKLTTSTN